MNFWQTESRKLHRKSNQSFNSFNSEKTVLISKKFLLLLLAVTDRCLRYLVHCTESQPQGREMSHSFMALSNETFLHPENPPKTWLLSESICIQLHTTECIRWFLYRKSFEKILNFQSSFCIFLKFTHILSAFPSN